MIRELTVDDTALTPEVAWLNKMVGNSPETSVIQVTALLGAVMLRRTDWNQWRETTIPARGIDQGTILVDAAKLTNALKSVSGELVITMGDEQLSITDGNRTVRLRPADIVFPTWPTFTSTADPAALGAIQLTRVLTSVGTDDSIPQLMSVAFDKGAMVTTDRFRLTKIGYDTSGFIASVPSAVLRAFAKNDGVVYVEPGRIEDADFDGDTPGAPWVRLKSMGRSAIGVTSDDQFPKWRALIPSEPLVSVTFRRDELLKATSGDEVSLTLTPPTDYADAADTGTLTVTSVSEGLEVEETVKLTNTIRYDYDGPLTVTLRSKYVKECLKAVGSGLMLLDATAPDKPLMFRDITENDLHLIMPVRKQQAS